LFCIQSSASLVSAKDEEGNAKQPALLSIFKELLAFCKRKVTTSAKDKVGVLLFDTVSQHLLGYGSAHDACVCLGRACRHWRRWMGPHLSPSRFRASWRRVYSETQALDRRYESKWAIRLLPRTNHGLESEKDPQYLSHRFRPQSEEKSQLPSAFSACNSMYRSR